MSFINQKDTIVPSQLSYCLKKLLKFTIPKGVGLIVLSAALFGLTMVVSKDALGHLPPLTLLTVQTASSVTFFWTIIFLQKIQVPIRLNTVKIALAGLLEPGLSYIVGIFGLSLTTASDSTIITTTEPVVTIALSWLILHERISKKLLAFAFLACIGVSLVAISDITLSQGSLLGDGLIFLSVLFASLYTVTTSKAIGSLAPVVLAAIQQSVALILFLVVTVAAFFSGFETINFNSANYSSLVIVILSGAFGYGLAFLLYLSALEYQPASQISLYLTLIPIFGTIGAYIMLGEPFLPSQGFGGALILFAVVGISRLPQQGSRLR